jgi:hypothetical protein
MITGLPWPLKVISEPKGVLGFSLDLIVLAPGVIRPVEREAVADKVKIDGLHWWGGCKAEFVDYPSILPAPASF